MSDTASFLELLYGDDPPGYVAVFNGQTKQTMWCLAADREVVVRAIRDTAQTANTYIGIGLQREALTPEKRGEAKSVIALPCLTLDVDIAHPTAHAKHALPHVPDLRTAGEILRKFPLAPTVTLSTGYGLLCCWLFHELWTLDDATEWQRADSVSRRFQAHVISLASDAGYQIDNTADLARIARVPGTFNRKVQSDVRPVRFLRAPHTDRRYAPSDFDEWCPLLADRTHDDADAFIGQIPTGSRHSYLTRLAGAMRRVGASDAEIMGALTVANSSRFAEPKTLRQLADVAADVAKRYTPSVPVTSPASTLLHRIAKGDV